MSELKQKHEKLCELLGTAEALKRLHKFYDKNLTNASQKPKGTHSMYSEKCKICAYSYTDMCETCFDHCNYKYGLDNRYNPKTIRSEKGHGMKRAFK